MTKHLFLSYSRRDQAIMQRIRDLLLAEGFPVWTDEGIETGTRSWKRAIEEAILNADGLVCLLSPDANQSEWVRAEIDFAELHGKQLYPMLVRGDERSAIPFGFAAMQWVDLRSAQNDAEFEQQISRLITSIQGRPEPAHPISEDALVTDDAGTKADEFRIRPPSLIAHIRFTEQLQNALDNPQSSRCVTAGTCPSWERA